MQDKAGSQKRNLYASARRCRSYLKGILCDFIFLTDPCCSFVTMTIAA
jgi:hypothetical protein